MELLKYLKFMVEKEASDLYLTVGNSPMMKVYGELLPLEKSPQTSGKVKEIAYEIMTKEQKETFEKKLEMNLAIADPDLGRFRVNIFRQKNEVALVVRYIKSKIPSFAELGLPATLEKFAMEKRGLILLVGATGSGKSTSLASLIDYRNTHGDGHIITIEDPIEYVHNHKKSIMSQREIGVDTQNYKSALRNALRQAPDVILIGEIRSLIAMEHAIAFSETGHLVLSTLHANNANQAIERIITFFPDSERKQILLDLSLNLKAIISQRLIPSVDGKRVLAVEILLATPLICDFIKRGEISSIKETMEKSEKLGMQTFDSALFKLFNEGKISKEEALRNSDSPTNLEVRMHLAKGVDEGSAKKFTLQAEKNPPPASTGDTKSE